VVLTVYLSAMSAWISVVRYLMNKGCLLELKGPPRTYAPCRTEYFEGTPRPTKCGVSPHLSQMVPQSSRCVQHTSRRCASEPSSS